MYSKPYEIIFPLSLIFLLFSAELNRPDIHVSTSDLTAAGSNESHSNQIAFLVIYLQTTSKLEVEEMVFEEHVFEESSDKPFSPSYRWASC